MYEIKQALFIKHQIMKWGTNILLTTQTMNSVIQQKAYKFEPHWAYN